MIDTELEGWRQSWQSETAVPADLRNRVQRQTLWMRIALVADILVTLTMGGGTTLLAIRSPRPEYLILAAATWFFLMAAWAFSLVARRGTWQPPLAETTDAFLDLSLRRCRAQLAGVWFCAALYLAEIAFCLAWIYRESPPRGLSWGAWLWFGSPTIDGVWALTVAVMIGLFWFRKRKLAELQSLAELRAELSE
jgi:hypothetical protein